MKTGKELKPGTVIRIDNDPWLVQKAEFTKSGRNSAIMKTKLKNLLTGYKTETVYGADDKLDDVILDRKEATLSFIGLGVRPPTAEWGIMVAEGASFMVSGEWWIALFPGAALVLMVLSVNLLGDWLRDALNPRMR